MSRGISDERAQKLSIIQLLASKRQEQVQHPTKRRTIIGLSDSDDDDSEHDAEPSLRLKADYSSPQPTTFNRLRKAGDAPPSQPRAQPVEGKKQDDGDLVRELEGLGLTGGAVTKAAPSKELPKPPPAANKNTAPRAEQVKVNKPSFSKSVEVPLKATRISIGENSALEYKAVNTEPAQVRKETIKTESTTISGTPTENGAGVEDGSLVLGDNAEFKLSASISNKLYAHQVVGVKWLHGLYAVGSGGILADDLGLGKTMQVSALLAGSFAGRTMSRAIVVAPKTLLAAWSKELAVCGLGHITHEYFGTQAERQQALNRVVTGSSGGVLLTTYGMVQHNSKALAVHSAHDADEGPLWDVLIMDEGHKLKNPKMQLRSHIEALPVRSRLLISGTPIQNNLGEMHALFDLVCPGLLGCAKSFKNEYERAITAGSDKHATVWERERGASLAAALRRTVAPYMLRREKKEVFGSGGRDGTSTETQAPSTSSSTAPGTEASSGGLQASSILSSSALTATTGTTTTTRGTTVPFSGPSPGGLSRKNDFVIWLRLTTNQQRLYEAFLNSDSVKAVLNQTSSALAALTVLKKICDHPALLSERAQEGIASVVNRAAKKSGGRDDDSIEDSSRTSEDDESEWDSELESEEEEEEMEEGEVEGSNTRGDTNWAPNLKVSTAAGTGAEKKARKKSNSKSRTLPHVPSAASTTAVVGGAAPPGAAPGSWAAWAVGTDVLEEMHATSLEASCKTAFVLSLLRNLVAEGHRTLVFSQSRVMLDILEAGVKHEGWRMCRVDGSVASAAERQARVEAFQTDPLIPVFLLTSQVGGLGLTLTAADRVIVVDPAWNPSVDSQSVDRAYRIGQTRDVVVYRLVSCGTVEDKIYRKQVFKGGLSRRGTEEGEQFRYFSAAELRDLFRLDPQEAVTSATQRHLHALHAHQRLATPELQHHLEFLKNLQGFSGVSDHDLLYSSKEVEGPPGGLIAAAAATPAPFTSPSGGSPRKTKARRGPGGVRNGGARLQQGWTGGGSDVSSMFALALNLGPPTATGAAELPSVSSVSTSHSSVESPEDKLKAKIVALEKKLIKQKDLLRNPALLSALGDGGAKISSRVVELEEELERLRAEEAGGGVSASVSIIKDSRVSENRGEFPQDSNIVHLVDEPEVVGMAAPPPPPPPPPPPRAATNQWAGFAAPAQLPPPPTYMVVAPTPEKQQHKEEHTIFSSPAPSVAPSAGLLPTQTAPPPSPFQRIRAGLLGVFGLSPALPAASELHSAADAVEVETRGEEELSERQVLRRMKKDLYDMAIKLEEAEASGNADAVVLRQQVEALYEEYTSRKAAISNQNTAITL